MVSRKDAKNRKVRKESLGDLGAPLRLCVKLASDLKHSNVM